MRDSSAGGAGPPVFRADTARADALRGFVHAALCAAPFVLVLVMLDDPGPAKGRGAETGVAPLLLPIVALAYLIGIGFVSALAGALGAVAAWAGFVTRMRATGAGVALVGGMLGYLWQDPRSVTAVVQAVLVLVLPALLATWMVRPR